VVAEAVFDVIGVVGVTRTEKVLELLIVLGTSVFVANEEGQGSAEGDAVFDARKPLNGVLFVARGTVAPSRQGCVDGRHVDGNAGWATVDNSTYGGSMGLAVGG
jgi:hypothetical protein